MFVARLENEEFLEKNVDTSIPVIIFGQEYGCYNVGIHFHYTDVFKYQFD
ncbi:hypothetical protein bthur0007_35690 [Bacillus thuringiensis serovar monterrey BGSC 4AJ1]|nr:hypothetical protein bthur0007_35690 [Bacillus thuringiensis serovar monterrey BGSC 4AJ1]